MVGAGIRGWRPRTSTGSRPNARVLLLDQHDFGGHAKRNEFVVDGQILSYGGTQSIDGPAHHWDGVAKSLLKDLGIDAALQQVRSGIYAR